MNDHSPTGSATILATSRGRGWRGLEAELLRIPPGSTHISGTPYHRLGIHVGRPVRAQCRCDGREHRRLQKHGDIDVVPAGLDGVWEDDRECMILRLKISMDLFRQAAIDLGRDPADAIIPRFQLRDPRLEAIAWALKAEIEADVPSDNLYADTLATALAFRLVEAGRGTSRPADAGRALLSRQRRLLADYIEDHLDTPLSLAELAALAGLSLSHLKTQFRNSFGVPPHQYVLHRRVVRAEALIRNSGMPLSQIALEAGFAHQSHMANSMKRLLGVSPGTIARPRN
ncbi:AraC family transcriptional regulator [Rhizobium ruizarguesonis]|uniref:AraC family transcriptional regulator n=1 Tax=Rhizobium ruizarguesonis TaxID=2081791 RepID=UPI00102F7186|nr:AraC family transcriptional regulator [Rhizobium ruizarguesonis]NEJ14686.1 helix-turn-helix domain-containing protein [Rhizobium ruizarguesonis]NEK25561.1 helix-turn-helix domain-containing protein [Rhizobium ruizarguesonis]TBD25390.1 AraC family transcriptional regulator [Rhizobium ruizarguesonis]TBD25760.1 AraC family transcriptional regulator [Rhizobium ruizarguesonis]TBD51556.1 AraC family transcriptional regulator [Rhizobium ruizarguesonis]